MLAKTKGGKKQSERKKAKITLGKKMAGLRLSGFFSWRW
jgi:hypothetical protein